MEQESFKDIGKFIYEFQFVEGQIEEIIILIANTDNEVISILMNELSFSSKLKVVEVMFSRFVDKKKIDKGEKGGFHKSILKVCKLGEARNVLVHSKYRSLLTVNGRIGLRQNNSTLKPKKGIMKPDEIDLLPEDFKNDFHSLKTVTGDLDQYTLKIRSWLDPE